MPPPARIVALLGAAAVATLTFSATPAHAAPLRSGYAADVPHRTDVRDLGRAAGTTPVSIALTLNYRNEPELQRLVQLQSDRRSPLYHHYLTSAQFANYFAPATADYRRAIVALQRAGFRITQTYDNRTIVDAVAPAIIAERYFKTEIHRVNQIGVGVRYANATPALIPRDLGGLVASVAGLSNLIVAKPTFVLPTPQQRFASEQRARELAQQTRSARTATPHRLTVRGRTTVRSAAIRPNAANVVADPGFESGGFNSWFQCGNVNAAITTARPHTGRYSERSGSTSGEPNGDTGVCQGVTVPASGVLSFWVYQQSNESNTQYAYQEADLLDSSGNVIVNLYRTVNNAGYHQLSYNLASYAGRAVYLYFGVHGDGYGGAYTDQYVDDVSLAAAGSSTPTPTPVPTASPTTKPTAGPSATPTPKPTATPTPVGGGGAPIGGALTGPNGGYGPVAVANGFDLPVQHGYNGTGRATGVAISGDYSDADLTAYLKQFGITRTGPATTRVEVDGGASYSSSFTDTNASVEAMLDVQTIVGLAPGTHLYMYLFPDLSSQSIEDGYNRAVSDGVIDVLNSSFGGCESSDTAFDSATNQIATQGAAKGITFNASTGDSGSDSCGNGTAVVSSPASGPEFTAIGGTSLSVNGSGGYVSETGWSGSGGGKSTYWTTQPSYQSGVANYPVRTIPDVAFPADPSTGTDLYFGGAWRGAIGGTSWASPIFSALQTEINQKQNSRNGFVNSRIYSAFKANGYNAFHDVTSGSNGAYSATTNYDLVTGIGSPKGTFLSGVE